MVEPVKITLTITVLMKKNRNASHSQRKINANKNMNTLNSSNYFISNKYAPFLRWCQSVQGIQTILTPREFEYQDHLNEWQARHHFNHDLNQNIPNKIVRGLAASRDISPGDILISVPYHALLTIDTAIDHDPVLSRVIGPNGRKDYGWIIDDNIKNNDFDGNHHQKLDESSDMNTLQYEVPLLAVALLYHRSLESVSPLRYYIDILLDNYIDGVEGTREIDSMPFLWDDQSLEIDGGTEGVKKLARDIRADMENMYENIVKVLIKDHPDIFGPPSNLEHLSDDVPVENGSKRERTNHKDRQGNPREWKSGTQYDAGDWMFSYENFKWAFAMVNSRHWHIPIVNRDNFTTHQSYVETTIIGSKNDISSSSKDAKPSMKTSPQKDTTSIVDDFQQGIEVPDPAIKSLHMPDVGNDAVDSVPPAQQPTENWVSDHADAAKKEYLEDIRSISTPVMPPNSAQSIRSPVSINQQKRSFLAPLADMLNFGPPCTRATYNSSSESFEVVATCSFLEGQEVTFWYSDDCDDIIIANYGFTHPMVPTCPGLEEWRKTSEIWKDHALFLSESLNEAYEEIDRMKTELNILRRRCSHVDVSRMNYPSDKRDEQQKSILQSQEIFENNSFGIQHDRRSNKVSRERHKPNKDRVIIDKGNINSDSPDHRHDASIRGNKNNGSEEDENSQGTRGGHGGIRRLWQGSRDDLGL